MEAAPKPQNNIVRIHIDSLPSFVHTIVVCHANEGVGAGHEQLACDLARRGMANQTSQFHPSRAALPRRPASHTKRLRYPLSRDLCGSRRDEEFSTSSPMASPAKPSSFQALPPAGGKSRLAEKARFAMPVVRVVGPDALARITKQFETFCHFNDLRILASAANRHGSTVWEAGKQKGLNCLVMMGMTDAAGISIPRTIKRPPKNLRYESAVEFTFTPTFEPGRVDDAVYLPTSYLVELSIGADDGKRFTHRVLENWYYSPRDNIIAVTESGWLRERLQMAWNQALTLADKDLSESFVVERLPRQPSGVTAEP